jgi:hypothetical protein
LDLDNCPSQLAQLPKALSSFSRVIACHGGHEPKVSLGLVPLLATALQAGQLEIVPMKRGGKNAADFGLAFWAGRLSAELPADTEFVVLSLDRDLDHVVHLLEGLGRSVRRLDGKEPLTAASNGAPGGRGVSDRLLRDYERTQLVAGSTPARRATLRSSIRAFCQGRDGADPDALFDALVARGVVSVDSNDRVTYRGDHDEIPF